MNVWHTNVRFNIYSYKCKVMQVSKVRMKTKNCKSENTEANNYIYECFKNQV